jgi:hypothetical protein
MRRAILITVAAAALAATALTAAGRAARAPPPTPSTPPQPATSPRPARASVTASAWPPSWPRPASPPPLPGASYGAFPAACHYRDGTFVAARLPELCPKTSPTTGARFSFWHPDLVTLHLWLWYPNPAGLYHGTNPWIRPFNHG